MESKIQNTSQAGLNTGLQKYMFLKKQQKEQMKLSQTQIAQADLCIQTLPPLQPVLPSPPAAQQSLGSQSTVMEEEENNNNNQVLPQPTTTTTTTTTTTPAPAKKKKAAKKIWKNEYRIISIEFPVDLEQQRKQQGYKNNDPQHLMLSKKRFKIRFQYLIAPGVKRTCTKAFGKIGVEYPIDNPKMPLVTIQAMNNRYVLINTPFEKNFWQLKIANRSPDLKQNYIDTVNELVKHQ